MSETTEEAIARLEREVAEIRQQNEQLRQQRDWNNALVAQIESGNPPDWWMKGIEQALRRAAARMSLRAATTRSF